MVYKLFGKPVSIKDVGCSHEDFPGCPIPPSVNIFVKVTNGCNAHCAFCSNAGAEPVGGFDIDKLEDIIREIKSQGIMVNRLNITGGEPSCVPDRVAKILEMMDKAPMKDVHVHLNTNGLLSDSQALMRHPRWDSISISLHHYEHVRLESLYGTRFPSDVFDFIDIDMMKVNASCNLIKGYIDSTTEAHKMMEFCIDHGFTRLGFVGLMSVNEFSRANIIPLEELHLEEIPHCYFTESRNRGTDCKCINYIYNKHMKVLDIYMRHYSNPKYCESSLLYDGHNLRQGFHNDNIIW